MDKATKKIICPRCSGNGYFKVKESGRKTSGQSSPMSYV